MVIWECTMTTLSYVARLCFRFQFTYWLNLQRIPITTDGMLQG